jgi:hypothetical protein
MEQVLEEVKAGKVVFTGISESGDDRLIWDAGDPKQIKEAMEKFDEYMNKGHIAFLIDDKGKQTEQIKKADWQRMDVRQREEILFKKPKEVAIVPQLVGG